MKKILVLGIILLFISVGFQPVFSFRIKNSNEIIKDADGCNFDDNIKKNNYDLIIVFAFIYGEVKNVRFEPHNGHLRLYFDIINVTLKGIFHFDWSEYYYDSYKLNESNNALHVNYFGINKLKAYLSPYTVNYLYGIVIDGQIVR